MVIYKQSIKIDDGGNAEKVRYNKMMQTPLNQRTVTVKLKRIELINLHMLVGAFIYDNEDREGMEKWQRLYDSLNDQRKEFDRKNGYFEEE